MGMAQSCGGCPVHAGHQGKFLYHEDGQTLAPAS